jgi:hypothetical protein
MIQDEGVLFSRYLLDPPPANDRTTTLESR